MLSQGWVGPRDVRSGRIALPMRYSTIRQQTDHPLRAVRALTDEALEVRGETPRSTESDEAPVRSRPLTRAWRLEMDSDGAHGPDRSPPPSCVGTGVQRTNFSTGC